MSESEFGAKEDQKDSTFINENGCKIWCKCWGKHLASPKALMFISHGAAEHIQYYDEIAELFTKQGLYVIGHDHQGHGQSEGSRMHISDIRHYVRDIFKHIGDVKAKFPDLPVFIVGHSMGGCIAALAALDRPDFFSGLVLIGPALTPDQDSVGPVRTFFGKILARVFPQMPVLWLNNQDVSRDPAVCQMYKDDPLNYHGGLKAKWGVSMLSALVEIESKMGEISCPFLVIHGDEDKMVSVRNSQDLYDKAASKDKSLKIYKGCFHQVHHELDPEKTECMNEMADWVNKHI